MMRSFITQLKENLMSKSKKTEQERSLGKEVARTAAINFTATAAGVAGIFGGLFLIGSLFSSPKNDQTESQESEPKDN